ncbi:uncharacterized protein P174DRAFT_507736 [Aspergillus novofumigatus IBT 16806]|uniref:Amidohydrolase-related domain-containing protein n=1 Tax=Aspergillus novofumigatus (strain IBT 16806) TaxID=1392255 RepID=A0A2I1BVR1_ASPN1|nr:uncharacterized protein P174DRAFT_507736 [Aspergillus novofumigatus IBT 16806]PKX89467.1 hypothetical protein P174DRAFT_507736 [Aspergillus novofumigatus IBT 16806]
MAGKLPSVLSAPTRNTSFYAEGIFTPEDVYESQLVGLYEALNAECTLDEQLANFRDIINAAIFDGTPTSLGIAYDSHSGKIEPFMQLTRARDSNISVITTHSMSALWDESGLHYGHLHPTAHLILDQAAVGIDAHFNYSTDILTQARIWLQRVCSIFYAISLDDWEIPANNPMPVNQAFHLATRTGGLALRRPDLGVIDHCAKADLVVWDMTSPGLLGLGCSCDADYIAR